jgi:ribonuclease HII
LNQNKNTLDFERMAYEAGYKLVAGLDEVGRGALCGPVVAASVIFPPEVFIPEVKDSKKLTPKIRTEIYPQIFSKAISVGIGLIRPHIIDRINILESTKHAMRRALLRNRPKPDFLLIDALKLTGVDIPQKSIIKGDQLSHSIAAASIIAKVVRDRIMCAWHEIYPNYGFDKHKGYGTADHIECLRLLGPSPIHRLTFKNVYDCRKLFLTL